MCRTYERQNFLHCRRKTVNSIIFPSHGCIKIVRHTVEHAEQKIVSVNKKNAVHAIPRNPLISAIISYLQIFCKPEVMISSLPHIALFETGFHLDSYRKICYNMKEFIYIVNLFITFISNHRKNTVMHKKGFDHGKQYL